MPIDEQRRIAEGGTIEVAVPRPGRSPEIKMMDVESIPEAAMKTIFVDGRARTAQEQIARIELREQQQPADEFDDADTFFTVRIPSTPRRIAAMKKAAAKAGKSPAEFIAARLKGVL